MVTRLDILNPQRSVQIAHAVLAATNTFGQPSQTHPHLIVCAVANESELEKAFEKLKASGVQVCSYREDDMNDSLTAIATAPLENRKPMRRFKLLC